MSKVFFHSDWHFNHEFVAETRGFDSAAEHDDVLLEAINSTVTKRDHIYVLGDLFMGSVTNGLDKIRRVNGVKHLVLGNHDPGHPMHRKSIPHTKRFLDVFDSVSLHEQIRLPGGRKVLLSHFPYEGDHDDRPDRYRQWRLRDEGEWLIHGHVHDTWTLRDRQVNVGVDKWLSPVSADLMATLIDGFESLGITRAPA
ncbi:metallophosphoesterase [Arthrobacter phage DrManhattan]|uniref:Metallophosphoesterase n=1 Tax=Arthrobacter phage DrManhattan TaxID=2419955 RepID=A0A3G2KFH7_9CAUD|nr:phosphoesterase [Arthrobacter phage DrManhattan]AYN57754.1 metallophosphoesterase [Arthrobacter phage DrManhattan]